MSFPMAALLVLIAPSQAPTAAPRPGTIAVEIADDAPDTERVFADAVTRALSDARFTPLPLASHSRYVARVTVTRTPRGVVPADARELPAMATLGQVFVPLPSGKSQIRGLVATDLTIAISLRGGNTPIWTGRATTIQLAGAAADAPATIAPKLAAAAVRQFPVQRAEPVSVP